jgi:hypothetical protein
MRNIFLIYVQSYSKYNMILKLFTSTTQHADFSSDCRVVLSEYESIYAVDRGVYRA